MLVTDTVARSPVQLELSCHLEKAGKMATGAEH